MAKAGKVLKQVLEDYSITQNKLALAMGINRCTIHGWVNETSDPSSSSVLKIRDALQAINPEAAEEFIQLYLED